MDSTAASTAPPRIQPGLWEFGRRHAGKAAVGIIAIAASIVGFAWYHNTHGASAERTGHAAGPARPTFQEPSGTPDLLLLDAKQQESIGLTTAPVEVGPAVEVVSAPGRVAPDEARFAYITPRATGVVRSVTAQIGQDVKAGELLALIDSPEVGQARLDLYTSRQERDIARTQAEWQATVHATTMELVDRLKKEETPEEIHDAFNARPVGEIRERLMTAYAQYRLGIAKMNRNRELYNQQLITTTQFEQVRAEYEVSQAGYQSLMDQTGFETNLASIRAQQALKKAETSVRAAEERLRILGVSPERLDEDMRADRQRAADSSAAVEAKPVSTYEIRAPFDGTILDRELIVPGVAVDLTHRLFTMANLATVWVEANIHESDFEDLASTQGADIRFRSLAYPGREFRGRVMYSGDLVEEKSRTVRLLATAENPDHSLKPGMFVDVKVLAPRENPVLSIPAAALLTRGDQTIVYVRMGDDKFAAREVDAEPPQGDKVVIVRGLEQGEEVVVRGASKLKAMAAQLGSEG